MKSSRLRPDCFDAAISSDSEIIADYVEAKGPCSHKHRRGGSDRSILLDSLLCIYCAATKCTLFYDRFSVTSNSKVVPAVSFCRHPAEHEADMNLSACRCVESTRGGGNAGAHMCADLEGGQLALVLTTMWQLHTRRVG